MNTHYEYDAAVRSVVDGDTVHVDVDLGFDIRQRMTLRLYGINAPEMNTDEGKAAKQWLIGELAHSGVVTIQTIKDKREKFGRYLAIIHVGSVNINRAMIEAGHAVEYYP